MRIEKPNRIIRTYRQSLSAPAAKVFPLLCPVREVEWASHWHPRLVVSASGIAERDCVFLTQDGKAEAIWFITCYEPESLFLEMVKLTPGVTACRLSIQLSDDNGRCIADITYAHTSLGADGDRFLSEFTAEAFQNFMRAWEDELNHYLTTGRKLTE